MFCAFFFGYRNGKLAVIVKDKVVNEFEKGNLQFLIFTTVVDVEINVLNATMVVIFNANMFGFLMLH